MATRIIPRKDTAANWGSVNPVLAEGEYGWDTTNGVLKVGDGTTAWNSLDSVGGGGGGAFVGDLPVIPKLWGTVHPSSDTAVRGAGLMDSTSYTPNDAASRLVVASSYVGLEQDTAGTVDSVAALYDSGVFNIYREMQGIYRSRFSIPDITSIRFFVGTASTTTTIYQSDTIPGTSLAGVQFSTSRGDTNWQFVISNTSTMGRVDSGVAASTAVLEVEVDFSILNEVTVRLLNESSVQLASHTFTTNLPVGGMRPWSGLRGLTAAVRQHRFFGAGYIAPA